MNYVLMHKTQPVLQMELDEETGSILSTGTLYAPEHLPVGITIADDVSRAGLNHWWRSRSIPACRSAIRESLTDGR